LGEGARLYRADLPAALNFGTRPVRFRLSGSPRLNGYAVNYFFFLAFDFDFFFEATLFTFFLAMVDSFA
jgi:hypothetical protein